MSPPPRGPTIKIKWPVPVAGVIASNTPEAPTADSTNRQPSASTEHKGPTGPSAGLNKDARADAISLKLLQMPELVALFSDNKLSAPKLKRKDDLIAAILKSPKLSHILKSTVTEIIEKRRKPKKGPSKQVAA
ncbi:hypothetical protein BJY52DRAFT_1223667 [Lactarius psammicola]|nr:hypothetical protein BJY52DRAFT_1223667 [Lactarius psammicola]